MQYIVNNFFWKKIFFCANVWNINRILLLFRNLDLDKFEVESLTGISNLRKNLPDEICNQETMAEEVKIK
jgi:hypothetical protein